MSDRVGKLRSHFDQTVQDIGQIETSMRGIDRHAERIAAVDFAGEGEAKLRLVKP